METYDACEALGTKGVIVIRAHGGDGRIEGTLTLMSPTRRRGGELPHQRDHRPAANRQSNWQPDRRSVARRCRG